jgi:NAD(P)H-flavin reductase
MVSRARVVSIKELSHTTRDFILKLDLPFHHEPGQFLQLSLDQVDSSMIWPDSRSFSIASYELPDNQLRLIIKKEGKFTTRIFNEIQIGSFITVKLPYGNFLPPYDFSATLCIAGGTGIAPFLSFFEYFKRENYIENFHLFHSTKYLDEAIDNVLLRKELKSHYKLFLTSTHDHKAINRRITIEDVTSNFNIDTNIYICGNKDFNSFFKSKLNKFNYKNINLEDW